MAKNTGTNAANELTNYICFDSSANSNDDESSSEVIRRCHALEQLVESRLAADMNAAARRFMAAGEEEDDYGDGSSSKRPVDIAAKEVVETSSFRDLQEVVTECSSGLAALAASAIPMDTDNENDNALASKKAKIPEELDAPAAAPAPAAPTSFSLFDLLDSQKGGGFSLPPRIMAYQIIEAYEREKKNNDAAGNSTNSDDTKGAQSALELLEKAEDMEDLSPDPDSWEEIRKILYEGLSLNPTTENYNVSSQSRYLKVHKSFHERCRGDNMFSSQLWGLAQNLVGSILVLSRRYGEHDNNIPRDSMDLFWDIAQTLLDHLSHLAIDHVMSCVGNEREVERMLLGICMILSNDFSACTMGMMEPFAGHFEVWARLVSPKTLMTILDLSGLGGAALRRCEMLGKNASSECIFNITSASGAVGYDSHTSLADVEHCNYLQSLSILRTILFQCGGTREVISMVYDQFTREPREPEVLYNSFLLPYGVASPDDVQTLLKEEEKERKQNSKTGNLKIDVALSSVMKPFQGLMKVKESNGSSIIDTELEILCTQTIQLIQRSK